MSEQRCDAADFERCVEFYRCGGDTQGTSELARWLRANPEVAARARQHAAVQQHLRRRYDPVLDEAIPPRLLSGGRHGTGRWPLRLAFVATLLAVAGTAWWFGSTRAGRPAMPSFSQRVANLAPGREHRMYRVQSAAAAPIPHPDLSLWGYHFVSGQVVDPGKEPIVEFVYSNAHGRQVQIYAQSRTPRLSRVPQVVTEHGISLARWRRDGVDYALVGDLPGDTLAHLAQTAAASGAGTLPQGPHVKQFSAQSSVGASIGASVGASTGTPPGASRGGVEHQPLDQRPQEQVLPVASPVQSNDM